VALSRSALAERFTEMIGSPPIQYLTQWRLTLAAQALRSGSDGIARIAESSGYHSGAAFTRAFKREFGVPPSAGPATQRTTTKVCYLDASSRKAHLDFGFGHRMRAISDVVVPRDGLDLSGWLSWAERSYDFLWSQPLPALGPWQVSPLTRRNANFRSVRNVR